MISRIVHPRMMRALLTLFSSVGTIENEITTQDPNSGEESISYMANPLMTAIRCYVEPIMGREVRRIDETIVERAWAICLQGYYPLIDVEDRIIINANQTHNILAVKHDDTRTVTFLDTEIINDVISITVPPVEIPVSDDTGYTTGFDWPPTYA